MILTLRDDVLTKNFSYLDQELVRLLQQTLRTSQSDRPPVRRPAPAPDSSAAPDQTEALAVTQEEVSQSEALLHERDEQIQSLCGHMERLALEKDSLQQELKGLKIKVGEINDQLGMLMETIQAKDEVIIKLSQQSSEQSGNDGSPPPNRDQQEVDMLKVQNRTLTCLNRGSFLLLSYFTHCGLDFYCNTYIYIYILQ